MYGIGPNSPKFSYRENRHSSCVRYPTELLATLGLSSELRLLSRSFEPRRQHVNAGPHVLVVSRDERLLQTRQLILEAFFQVNGAGRLQEVQALLSKREFDLVVLCHSLTESDCRRISEFVNCQSNRPKILMLRATGSDLVRPGADE